MLKPTWGRPIGFHYCGPYDGPYRGPAGHNHHGYATRPGGNGLGAPSRGIHNGGSFGGGQVAGFDGGGLPPPECTGEAAVKSSQPGS